MKKIACIFLLTIALHSGANAQLLQNTTWTMYDPLNVFAFYAQFANDTFSISTDNISYTATSIYNESGNIITIYDYTGNTGCPVTDTGAYNFNIANDTLQFTLIADPCFSRAQVLDNYYGVALLTSIDDKNIDPDYCLFPNPSANGIFNLKIAGNKNEYQKFIISNIEGKRIVEKIMPEFKNDVAVINLANLNSGVYFLTLQGKTKNKVFKLIR
nr:T9SS type A sorting domain-containing protein [Bacteroidota bacterium]